MRKIILFLLLIFLTSSAYSYDVKWSTFDGGGSLKTSANYILRDSIGQASSIIYIDTNNKLYSGFLLPPLPPIIILKTGLSMITIPVSTNKTFAEIFGDDASVWRYDSVSANYTAVNLTDIPQIGKGYFVKVTSDKNITLEGTPTTSGDIVLKQGWNLIGNPFDYDVLWSETKVGTDTIDTAHKTGKVANYAWTYDPVNQQYKLVHPTISGAIKKLEKGKAYWVLSGGDYTITISSNPAPAKEKQEPLKISDENFSIRISATAGNISDTYNFCGVTRDYNLYRIKEPPRFKEREYLNLYFTEGKDKMAVNFKEPKDRQVFEFEVETDIVNTDVTINIDTSNLPEGYRVKLIDLSREYGVGSNEYIYNSGNGKTRKFKLIVEKPLIDTQEKALSLEYTYSYPNPYSGKRTEVTPAGKLKYTADSLTFRYKATGDIKKVVIEIYNIKGKLIERFEDTTIDGEANYDFAEKLANGVYIYRITISDGKKNVSKRGKIVILR
jgi:hypothetical protein